MSKIFASGGAISTCGRTFEFYDYYWKNYENPVTRKKPKKNTENIHFAISIKILNTRFAHVIRILRILSYQNLNNLLLMWKQIFTYPFYISAIAISNKMLNTCFAHVIPVLRILSYQNLNKILLMCKTGIYIPVLHICYFKK